MGFIIGFFFLALPLIEIAIYIEVGSQIGALTSIVLTLFTAAAGLAVVRQQGLGVLNDLDRASRTGEDPAAPLLSGALLAMAGLLLFLPGFLTDAVGILLLIPPLRHFLVERGVANRVIIRRYGRRDHPDPGSVTIDAEYWETTERDDKNDGSPPRDRLR